MDNILKNLEPEAVWNYFYKITQIPHCSKHEEALTAALIKWAEEAGCKAERDEGNNVLISIKPSSGMENAPSIALQAHIDMVCEKNSDSSFNFKTDSLILKIEDGWIKAVGTSLGADNAIGMAMGLALMNDDSFSHGPIELLFTSDEETGLNGALKLRQNWLKSKILINVDTEEEGEFIIGCAGGSDTDIELDITREETDKSYEGLEITVKGLLGGHSGMDINLNRGNAIKITALLLKQLREKFKIKIISVDGGDKHNAIPREARALIALLPEDKTLLKNHIATFSSQLKEVLEKEEQDSFEIAATEAGGDLPPLNDDSAAKAVNLITGIYHGVTAMSKSINGAVESSTNLANIRTLEDSIKILTSSRSSKKESLKAVTAQINAVSLLAGAKAVTHTGYPPWQPDPDTKLIKPAEKIWTSMFKSTPLFNTIHAGLECGIIKERYPQIDVISLGPNIVNPHSPFEKTEIDSTKRVFAFLKEFLKELAG